MEPKAKKADPNGCKRKWSRGWLCESWRNYEP